MPNEEDSRQDERGKAALARLTALYRLRDQAIQSNRPAMLHSVEHLIKMESRRYSPPPDSLDEVPKRQ